MAKFKLEIECDNAAFDDDAGPEIARILAEVIGRTKHGIDAEGDSGPLHDVNGNRVGNWYYTP